MSHSGLFSHPGVCMEDHINGVIKIAKILCGSGRELPKWFYIPLAFHDFGKATEYFQEYIKTGKKSKYSEHSYLSAVFCLHLADALGLQDKLLECFLFPLKHHTHLKGLDNTFDRLSKNETKEILKKQLEKVSIEKFNQFVQNLEIPECIKEKAKLDEKSVERLKKMVERIDKIIPHLKELFPTKDFFDFNLFFSILLDADKTQAGSKGDTLPDPKLLTFEKVECYKQNFCRNTQISSKREEAYKEAVEHFTKAQQNYHTFILNLPTGMGKTLIGLTIASELAKKYKLKRIIYSLPFLSIIDQTETVLRKGIGLKDSTEILVHHHLSEAQFDEKDAEYDFETSRVFYEGWNSGLILTTFYQLFYTILGFENSYLRRFNKLRNSVIILDELQALPHRYWAFLEDMIDKLTDKLNCKIILMTATNPIGDRLSKALHLVDKDKYRESLNRYRVYVDLSEKTIDDIFNELRERVEKEEDKSFLIVLNTISSSQYLFRKLKEKFVYVPMTYLSTAVIPAQRRERIRQIGEGKYRIVVSTQVVEAGVDVDFDVVYRDFAPLDSMYQSAGRCNRHGERGMGEVKLIRLVDDNGKIYAKRIYDTVLLDATKEILSQSNKHITEKEFLELVDKYYEELYKRISTDQSKEIIKAMKNLNYKELTKFKLIEEEVYKTPVFVELDNDAEEVLNRVKELMCKLKSKKLKLLDVKREFEKIKADFYSYVVNVALSKAKDNNIPFDKDVGMYVIKKDYIEIYYDYDIGFSLRDGELIW